jgi:hypothetical protein
MPVKFENQAGTSAGGNLFTSRRSNLLIEHGSGRFRNRSRPIMVASATTTTTAASTRIPPALFETGAARPALLLLKTARYVFVRGSTVSVCDDEHGTEQSDRRNQQHQHSQVHRARRRSRFRRIADRRPAHSALGQDGRTRGSQYGRTAQGEENLPRSMSHYFSQLVSLLQHTHNIIIADYL